MSVGTDHWVRIPDPIPTVVEFKVDADVTDGEARLIASRYQSPGYFGDHLAGLSTGAWFSVETLIHQINLNGREFGWPQDLEYLATWAINLQKREV